MRLADAITRYVVKRRLEGSPLTNTEVTLRSFCKHCGDLDLEKVTAEHVSSFANNPKCSPVTRVSKFSSVNCFLEYCAVRGMLPRLALVCPPKPRELQSPYIYSPAELVALLNATEPCQSKATELDARTFRRLILVLYGTGVSIQEVLSLTWSSVDLRKRLIAIDKSHSRASRVLPIGTDLVGYFGRWRKENPLCSRNDFIFRSSGGRAITQAILRERFARLRRLAGLRPRPDGRVPRLSDLRYTFAVHRLQDWIRRGDDLNRLIPALSTYMGYKSLTTAEQFLAYVPNRFTCDLQKLSSSKGKPWVHNPKLMAFLASL